MATDVFLSYAGEDRHTALQVCSLLEARGVTCWIAPRDVAPGAVWDEAIIDAIAGARSVVLLLSAHANSSAYVKSEVSNAFSRNKPVIVFRLENALPGRSLELYVARHHWSDAFPGPLEGHVDRLAGALRPITTAAPAGEPVDAASLLKRAPDASIAVLPFQDLGPDPDNQYFSDGLAEELLSALARLPGLRVAARTSAFTFRGQNVDVQTIGERLRVGAVLEGSVRRAGPRLRVTVRLVKVADGYQLWSERFDRTMDDVFAIQEEIAQAIVDRLKVRPGDAAGQPLITRHTENREAYELYLRGRFFWSRRFEGGLSKAIEHFEQAIRLDPGYALAHTGVADAFAMLGFYSLVLPKGAFARARAAAERALQIDPDLAEAHASMALVRLGADYDIAGARNQFELALRMNPAQPLTRVYYSWVLVLLGRPDEGLQEARRAQDDDPMSQTVASGAAYTAFLARRYDAAIDICERALELGAGFLVALYVKGMALGKLERYDEAIAALSEAVDGSQRAPFYVGLLGMFLALAGRRSEAEAILREVASPPPGRYVPPHVPVYIHAGLGEFDRALDWQEKACEDGASPFNFLSPAIEVLFTNPRHLDHLTRMGLRINLSPYLALSAPVPSGTLPGAAPSEIR